jgi:histidinol phosphatase-like PHP family hydrolase
MIDLHTHTTFSDGELIPAELVRRARVSGYKAVAITDHADSSNLGFILESMARLVDELAPFAGMEVFFGVELTHVPPGLLPGLIQKSRRQGAQLVLVHGETLVEPVERGTNLAAIESGVDILAHPGLISRQEANLAAENNVALEISTRKGHCLANGHVAAMARITSAPLVINNDAHAPGDLISRDLRRMIALGAGLSPEEYQRAEDTSREVVKRLLAP